MQIQDHLCLLSAYNSSHVGDNFASSGNTYSGRKALGTEIAEAKLEITMLCAGLHKLEDSLKPTSLVQILSA